MFSALLLGSLTLSPLGNAFPHMPTDHSQEAKPVTVKVLLAKDQDRVLIEARGRYLVYDPFTSIEIGSGSTSQRAYVAADSRGLIWNDLFPSAHQMRLVPGDSQSTLLVNGIEYRGCIEVYATGGKLQVVNEVDVERYLRSTLAFQVSDALEEEVLDALAIVARTQVYATLQQPRHPYYDIQAEEVQYQGHALTLLNVKLDRAIQRTQHMVLTYQNRPFMATWTSDSAGKTADYASIFRKNISAPHGVETPLAAHDRLRHAWSFAITRSDLARLLQVPMISEVDLYQDPSSSKVYAVRVRSGEAQQDINYFKLNKILDGRLRSNDFSVKQHGDQIVFTGFGEGHGVGLCLLSAVAMAEQGALAPKILATFFPDTQMEHMKLDTISNMR